MEKEILKTIEKKVKMTFNRYPATSTTTQEQPIKSVFADYSNAAKEIDKLTKDHYMKFVEWAKDSMNIVFNVNYGKYFWTDNITEATTEELYDYWLKIK